MLHKLKTHPEFFINVFSGIKTFEIRKDDRDFKIGDELLLEEFLPKGDYTGRNLHRRIDYILKGGQFGIETGFVALAISKI